MNFIGYLALWICIPIFLHLFLVIPLSRIINMEVQYINWAAAGIWVVSGGMTSFLETSIKIHKINYETRQIDVILKSPMSNFGLLIAILLRGVILGFIQFIISIFITCTLNHEYLGILNILMIIIHLMTVIIFFSVFGIFLGLIISHRIILIQLSLILFIIICLGMGLFIPTNIYPESYLFIINKIPLVMIFQNLQSIIIHQNIQWISFFLTLSLIIILFFITLITSKRVFRQI